MHFGKWELNYQATHVHRKMAWKTETRQQEGPFFGLSSAHEFVGPAWSTRPRCVGRPKCSRGLIVESGSPFSTSTVQPCSSRAHHSWGSVAGRHRHRIEVKLPTYWKQATNLLPLAPGLRPLSKRFASCTTPYSSPSWQLHLDKPGE